MAKSGTERSEALLKIGASYLEPPRAIARKDLSPDRDGADGKFQPFSLDKPTFRSDKPLFMKKGGSVRGNGCCTKAKKCKMR